MVEYTYVFYDNGTKVGEVVTEEALLDRDIDNAVTTIAGRGTAWQMGDPSVVWSLSSPATPDAYDVRFVVSVSESYQEAT